MKKRSTIEEALLAANLGEYINQNPQKTTKKKSKAKGKL